jgi:translation initiation factor IF-2
VTDIVVLVVAADDGVMPQTIEAVNHARAAEVPIIVAVNKVDRPDANPDRVLEQLSQIGLVPEKWGGDTICVEISALQSTGIDELLEQISVVAELEELVARPTGRATGTVLEANLEAGRGPVATVMVQEGVLDVGDSVVAGAAWGKVRPSSTTWARPSRPPARRRRCSSSGCPRRRGRATRSASRVTSATPARSRTRGRSASG